MRESVLNAAYAFVASVPVIADPSRPATHAAHRFAPWPGFGLMGVFVAAALAAACLALERRDA
jgi:hypothetical protein